MKRIVGAAIIAVAAFGGAGAFDDNTVRDESGAIIQGGGLGAFAVQIGDCFNIPQEELIQSLEAVPCSDPHDAEAYDSFMQVGDEWPGQDAVDETSAWGCYDRFETFVGMPWDNSELDFWYLEPTKESWEQGNDREVICAITSYDGSQLVGSMRGANR